MDHRAIVCVDIPTVLFSGHQELFLQVMSGHSVKLAADLKVYGAIPQSHVGSAVSVTVKKLPVRRNSYLKSIWVCAQKISNNL